MNGIIRDSVKLLLLRMYRGELTLDTFFQYLSDPATGSQVEYEYFDKYRDFMQLPPESDVFCV